MINLIDLMILIKHRIEDELDVFYLLLIMSIHRDTFELRDEIKNYLSISSSFPTFLNKLVSKLNIRFSAKSYPSRQSLAIAERLIFLLS